MRRCIVDKCINSDHIVLCHRFPKNRILAQKWQISLNLTECPLDTLISKYTVCFSHFECTDYRNSLTNSLNITAIPKIQATNPRSYTAIRAKNAAIASQVPSTNNWTQQFESKLSGSDSIELLHRDDEGDDTTEIDESLNSNPCTNDEISILTEDVNATDALIQSIDGADFTMLDAASCPMYMPYMANDKAQDATEESSAFILESQDGSVHSNDFRSGSTDSDVEVLVSEALFESQWSETDRSALVLSAAQNTSNTSAVSPCISYQSDISVKNELGTDVLDLEFGHLEKFQLIEIIKSQSNKIHELENKLDTFRLAQEQLFTHFEAFRNTVCAGVQM